jgi:Poly(R)-hydroxyalkanoic acid synthase subunit (PHA_synth_III_E)
MAAENENTKPADPFDALRGMRDSYIDAMSKVMMKAVNSEEYAQATGVMLNSALVASAPFREALDKAMTAALQHSSMPSRQEVAALAGRFTNVEMRLDDMEAKLDRIIELCSVARPAPVSAGPEPKLAAKAKVKRAAGAKASPRQNRGRKKG